MSDIDDCCYDALYLGDIGRADEKKLCIDVGSEGGYTTLACLTFKSVFKAGRNFNTMITICGQVSCKLVKYLFPLFESIFKVSSGLWQSHCHVLCSIVFIVC